MAFKWMIRRLHRWGVSRRKLRGGFLHSKLGDRILHRELWIPNRESFARAWLVGMVVTMIPFLPLQTVIACVIGFMVGANLPVCFILQYVSNPATAVVQLPASYVVGCFVLGRDVGAALHRVRTAPSSLLSGETFGVLLLGSIVLGLVFGLAGYFLTQLLWVDRVRKKPVRPKPPA
ncbi:MAG TPA: DUF2062 domain-containing protein [Opitutaceae bacterium]